MHLRFFNGQGSNLVDTLPYIEHKVSKFINQADWSDCSAMARHVDPDYFEHPSIIAYILLPVTWGLLPISGYAPHLLKPYVSAAVYGFLLDWNVSQ